MRAVVALGGFAIVLGGLALLVLPGPGIPLLVIGLGLLALEFRWAEAALARTLHQADWAAQRARATSRRTKAVAAAGAAAAMGGVGTVLAVWGVPGLPV